MIRLLVKNDGSDEIYSIKLAVGINEDAIMYNLIWIYGDGNMQLGSIAKQLLNTQFYKFPDNVSLSDAKEVHNTHNERRVQVITEDKFKPINAFLSKEVYDTLTQWAKEADQ